MMLLLVSLVVVLSDTAVLSARMSRAVHLFPRYPDILIASILEPLCQAQSDRAYAMIEKVLGLAVVQRETLTFVALSHGYLGSTEEKID